MDIKNEIAHLSDIHIRYASRHEEYKQVFLKTIEDLKEKKPRRIVITGDVFHIKITLSPKAVQLAGWFLKELSKIAPVDIILGNHDLNLQSLEQGNAIEPIIDLIEDGYIVRKEDKNPPKHIGTGNGVFFYLDSGYYDVDEDIVYGVYSCLDNEILTLKDKEKDKTYIALYHGPVYGCRGDNGYELKGEALMKLSSFNNFDIVMLGDIHEHQSFSLVQQNFAESIDKGYLIWDLNNCTFKKYNVPNDVGYASLNISRGELIEERVEDLKLSNDPSQTKVRIVWEAFEEEYSVEKEKQIERFVKNRYGCKNVSVDCKYISKSDDLDTLDIEEGVDYSNSEDFYDLLQEFVESSEYDNVKEVLELAKKIDEDINYKKIKGKKWYLNKMEVWNLFGFPKDVTTFDFDALEGVTGIFGKNFSGKTNIIRALVWIAYREILGGGDSHKLVNMYTDSDKAGGRLYLTIDSQKFYIERTIKVSYKKDGTPKVSYGIEYMSEEKDSEGKVKWVKVDSEKKATEKAETNNVIENSIGEFKDFTKVVLQAQGGEGNFLEMSQQPKNDLINKYLGLEVFRDRHKYAKEKYNEIKTKQKILGDPKVIKDNIKEEEESIKNNKKEIKKYEDEKKQVDSRIEVLDSKIINLTKSLINVEETNYKTVEEANKAIENIESSVKLSEKRILELETWLSENFKKEVPSSELNKLNIENSLKTERSEFSKEKSQYTEIDSWIKNNKKLPEVDIEPINKKIIQIETALSSLKDKLEISKGKQCPTCGNVEKKADPTLEQKCISDIERGNKALIESSNNLKEAKNTQIHNNTYDKKENLLGALKNSLQTRKIKISELSKDLELCNSIESIKSHNKIFDDKNLELSNLRNSILDKKSSIETINKEIDLIKSNESVVLENKKINNSIKELEYDKKAEKLIINQLNSKITDLKSSNRVSENNIENFKDKLDTIIEAESLYAKYSIYLQAVHRDGIPSRIIRKKLPIINYKINSILSNLVDFKVELTITPKGDVKEYFYFCSMEKDSLPMTMASGSQKFIGSVAIRDALHFVSTLTKPSLCIIDEGFGTLDDELTVAMQSVIGYIKNKYKNSWIITHKNVIKDFVDNIIQVSKDTKSLTQEQIEENSKAGISVFDVKH
jgi:DNA repair exonuclease SbcCD ATPase subunit